MLPLLKGVSLLTVSFLCWACASVPPSRIADYVPTEPVADESVLLNHPRPLEAALVLISDTLAPDASPNLPDEAFTKLGEELKQEISRALPVSIKTVVPVEDGRSFAGNQSRWSELAQQHGVEYLAVVVLSSTEQEYPVTLFLGWTTHAQPGLRRDNWSLVEFALLDAQNGTVLARAEGRGWATLDYPTAPGINQWYPVIYLRPQDPNRPIWPPTYEGAPYTLRVVSFDQAAKRLTSRLQHDWIGELERDAAARRGSG